MNLITYTPEHTLNLPFNAVIFQKDGTNVNYCLYRHGTQNQSGPSGGPDSRYFSMEKSRGQCG